MPRISSAAIPQRSKSGHVETDLQINPRIKTSRATPMPNGSHMIFDAAASGIAKCASTANIHPILLKCAEETESISAIRPVKPKRQGKNQSISSPEEAFTNGALPKTIANNQETNRAVGSAALKSTAPNKTDAKVKAHQKGTR